MRQVFGQWEGIIGESWKSRPLGQSPFLTGIVLPVPVILALVFSEADICWDRAGLVTVPLAAFRFALVEGVAEVPRLELQLRIDAFVSFLRSRRNVVGIE